MAMTCGTCKHWERGGEGAGWRGGVSGLGLCHLAAKGSTTYLNQDEVGLDPAGTQFFVNDASDYWASLYTIEAFFCACHSEGSYEPT